MATQGRLTFQGQGGKHLPPTQHIHTNSQICQHLRCTCHTCLSPWGGCTLKQSGGEQRQGELRNTAAPNRRPFLFHSGDDETEIHSVSSPPKPTSQNQNTKYKIKTENTKLELSDSKAHALHSSYYRDAHF